MNDRACCCEERNEVGVQYVSFDEFKLTGGRQIEERAVSLRGEIVEQEYFRVGKLVRQFAYEAGANVAQRARHYHLCPGAHAVPSSTAFNSLSAPLKS